MCQYHYSSKPRDFRKVAKGKAGRPLAGPLVHGPRRLARQQRRRGCFSLVITPYHSLKQGGTLCYVGSQWRQMRYAGCAYRKSSVL